MNCKTFLTAALLVFSSMGVSAGNTDLLFAPATSAGHDFNHAPIGQTFKALAPSVTAGIFIADEESFTNWLKETYPDLPPYPYAVASSVTVKVQLLDGEGVNGTVLDSRVLTLNKPFMGFVEVDYAAAGLVLEPRHYYTLLMTDVSNQAYPNGVTGWVVPSVHDFSSHSSPTPGAYPDGLPILQGILVTNDAGIGDNAFEVLDVDSNTPSPLVISGTLPYGQIGQSYSASLSADGGVPPYIWSASGLPDGLLMNSDGSITGTPTMEGTFTVEVIVVDSDGIMAIANYDMVIYEISCIKPKGSKPSKGKGNVSEIGDHYIIVKNKRIDYADCTSVNYGGEATSPAVGDKVEWDGFVGPNGNVMAQTLTFN